MCILDSIHPLESNLRGIDAHKTAMTTHPNLVAHELKVVVCELGRVVARSETALCEHDLARHLEDGAARRRREAKGERHCNHAAVGRAGDKVNL